MAKASSQNGSDCEERKLGEQNGLDTSFAEKLYQKHAMQDVRLREILRNDLSLLLIKNYCDELKCFWFYGQKDANYPSSPSCKRCEQGIAHPTRMCSVEEKSLSSPPGKYGRKAETLRNWRGSTTRGAACGSI